MTKHEFICSANHNTLRLHKYNKRTESKLRKGRYQNFTSLSKNKYLLTKVLMPAV